MSTLIDVVRLKTIKLIKNQTNNKKNEESKKRERKKERNCC